MKKARIMLTAIAVFAVVGGALAFKAKTFTARFLYVPAANGQCTSVKISAKTTVPGAPAIFTSASTASTTAPCPLTWTTTTVNQ